MANILQDQFVLLPISGRRKARWVGVLLLGLALATGSPQVGFGQTNQQQEQQQQQARDQQQREQQQREQLQREQERTQLQQHSSSEPSVPNSNTSREDSHATAARPSATDAKRATTEIQPGSVERKINGVP